jgi:ATP-dependent Clp protease ATP-binding subunit ClpA
MENAPTYEDFVKTRIETKPYKETELLQVSVTGKSPEQAQEANQLLIDTFLKRLAEISHVEQRTTREFLQKRVVTAKSELEQAENKYDLETAARLRHGTLPRLEKELEELKSKDTKKLLSDHVDEEDIASIISKWTNIPLSKLVSSEKEKLLNTHII